jgi:DNA ligase-1
MAIPSGLPLSALTALVERVRATSKKNEKVGLIADVLRQARGREAELLAMYLTGALPQGRIGLGWAAIHAALEGAPPPQGDPLALVDVDRAFEGLAAEGGAGSTERRARALRALLTRAREEERRFLAALLLGEVRQGALDGLVQEAIARAAGLPPADVRQAAMLAPSLGEVARAALEDGASGLTRFSLRLLSPIVPMLASTADDTSDALEGLGEAAFEYRLDGARIQLHKAGDEVRVLTGELRDATARLPELVEWARALEPPGGMIIGRSRFISGRQYHRQAHGRQGGS